MLSPLPIHLYKETHLRLYPFQVPCLHLPYVLDPVLTLYLVFTSSAPIIPALDAFMSQVCYTLPPCTNATLNSAATTIAAGCASDAANLTTFNSDALVMNVFKAYPVVREVLCLKT
jgi:hypothetical protein